MPNKDGSATIVLVGDPHGRLSNPVSRTDDYKAAFVRKFAAINQIATKAEADVICLSGDVFDQVPTDVPHALVTLIAKILLEMPCPVVTTPGNHDMRYKNMELLHTTPLGTLAAAQIVRLATTASSPVEIRSAAGDVLWRVWGREYSAKEDLSFMTQPPVDHPKNEVNVLITHFCLGPSDGLYYGTEVQHAYHKVSKEAGGWWDIVNVGHLHNNAGVFNDGDTLFAHLGAVMRGALREENIERTIQVAVVRVGFKPLTPLVKGGKADVEGTMTTAAGKTLYYRCKVINLPAQPASEIFDLQARQEMKEEEEHISQFVAQLEGLEFTGTDPRELVESPELQVSSAVKARVLRFLDMAEQQKSA